MRELARGLAWGVLVSGLALAAVSLLAPGGGSVRPPDAATLVQVPVGSGPEPAASVRIPAPEPGGPATIPPAIPAGAASERPAIDTALAARPDVAPEAASAPEGPLVAAAVAGGGATMASPVLPVEAPAAGRQPEVPVPDGRPRDPVQPIVADGAAALAPVIPDGGAGLPRPPEAEARAPEGGAVMPAAVVPPPVDAPGLAAAGADKPVTVATPSLGRPEPADQDTRRPEPDLAASVPAAAGSLVPPRGVVEPGVPALAPAVPVRSPEPTLPAPADQAGAPQLAAVAPVSGGAAPAVVAAPDRDAPAAGLAPPDAHPGLDPRDPAGLAEVAEGAKPEMPADLAAGPVPSIPPAVAARGATDAPPVAGPSPEVAPVVAEIDGGVPPSPETAPAPVAPGPMNSVRAEASPPPVVAQVAADPGAAADPPAPVTPAGAPDAVAVAAPPEGPPRTPATEGPLPPGAPPSVVAALGPATDPSAETALPARIIPPGAPAPVGGALAETAVTPRVPGPDRPVPVDSAPGVVAAAAASADPQAEPRPPLQPDIAAVDAEPAAPPAEPPARPAVPPVGEGGVAVGEPRGPDLPTAPDLDPRQPAQGAAVERTLPGRPAGRLPTVGDTAVGAAPGAPEAPAGPAAEPDLPAIERFARPFDVQDARPRVAVLLVDGPDGEAAAELAAMLPFPVSFAIDGTRADATEATRRYRGLGFEVVLMAPLPAGAVPGDVSVALQGYRRAVDEAVAMMEAVPGGLQTSRPVAAQAVAEARLAGLGVVTWSGGLNPALGMAEREGVPAATILRDLGTAKGDAAVVRRLMDQVTLRAGQDGVAIVVGPATPELLAIVAEWASTARGQGVALAPLSTVLLRR